MRRYTPSPSVVPDREIAGKDGDRLTEAEQHGVAQRHAAVARANEPRAAEPEARDDERGPQDGGPVVQRRDRILEPEAGHSRGNGAHGEEQQVPGGGIRAPLLSEGGGRPEAREKSGNRADERTQLAPEHGDRRQQRTQMNRDVERVSARAQVPNEGLREQQVAVRRNGEEFGDALQEPEQDPLDDRHSLIPST